MRKYALNAIELDKLEIQEDDTMLTVPAVITREAVLDYDGMKVYEPKEEVEKAAFTAQNAWIVEEHPPDVILSDPKLIRGTVRNPVFVEDRIKADLAFFKDRCSPKYLADIKTGKAKSVSIGFFFECMPQAGEFKGEHYDYIKRDILIDHVAVGSWMGRCSYPACGIGVNARRGADPYPNEHSCRLRDPETLEIVGSGTRKHNGKTYRIIYGKPKNGEGGSVEQAYRYPVETWSETEARKHCQEHDGSFEPATKEESDKLASDQEEGEGEKLRQAAEAREKKYGIKFREDEGHLTPPEGYPEDEEDYGDPVNYKYPLKPQDRCQNALARWSQYREEYSQPERNIVYERIIKAALKYNIALKYNPDLPEARALPTAVKERLGGYEEADALIGRIKTLINQL